MDILQGLPLLVLALVMAAALGPSIPNVDPRDLDPDHPAGGPRHPLERAVDPRVPVRGGGARARPRGTCASPSATSCPIRSARSSCSCTAQLGSAILVEAALSFLGLGVPEPYPSWGRMLSVSAAEYAQKAPWLVLFPGIAISLAVFGSNLLGDALRDTLDPRLRGA